MRTCFPPLSDRTTMSYDISNVLKAVGPAASIIFAAWIFMGFLQQRYDTVVARYQTAIETYRSAEMEDDRRLNMKEQILVYKRRCELMSRANIIGLSAAILLILTLITGEIDIMAPGLPLVGYVSAASALAGFSLVILATVYVIVEGSISQRQIVSELMDVPDLARSLGQEPGRIGERAPARA